MKIADCDSKKVLKYPEKEIAEESGQDLGVDPILGRVGENLAEKCWKNILQGLFTIF